ncbi:MAG: hypothetical protein BWY99_00370 [Synergistetes bacterium ADurb.BinA166]|nr:MAG: hypothetical protein BWY99_00370 [Synergistetes bacterium ADurb.BinA166]
MTASKELRDAWRDRQEARNLCSFRYQGTTFFLRKIMWFPGENEREATGWG